MSSNWNYVAAGYALTAGALVAYFTWVKLRIRKVRRSLPDDRS